MNHPSLGTVAHLKHSPRIRRYTETLGLQRMVLLPGPGLVLVEWLRGLLAPIRLEYERERRARGQLPELRPMSWDELARAMNQPCRGPRGPGIAG